MPAVSSHAFDQVFRSRPEVSSSAPSRSDRRVLPNACALEVRLHAAEELVHADVGDELLEHATRPWRR